MTPTPEDLRTAIEGFVAADGRLRVLAPAEANRLVGEVAEVFVVDPNSTWWWESLRGRVDVVEYDSDGLAAIESQPELGKISDPIFLVATDDEPSPWLVVCGPARAVLDMLSDQWMFEFFLVDDSRSWVIFDTHHNSLVVARLE